MTIEEIHSIEVGDKLYVDRKIHRRIFNGDRFTVYKPDKFYTVFEIDKTADYIKLITSSELGLSKIIVYRSSIPTLYMQHFNLLKNHQFISSIDYFVEI